MRKQSIVLILLLSLTSIIVGCSRRTPPLPKVIAGKTEISLIQTSYCWGNLGCADYVGGKSMLKDEVPTRITPEAKIFILFNYKPAPSQLIVQQFKEDKTIEISLKNSYFVTPKEKGIYYYGISAYWKTDDGTYSKDDTSSVFVIEVK